MIALVDCNNFYVSCERVFCPKINNKPVVILSNNDGCIISRSNEAKKLGLKMGEPFFKKRDFIKENKVHVFSTNLTLYNDFSNRVMSILLDLNSKVEIYSIDEAFIDFSKKSDHLKYAYKLKHKIKKWTGIPVSIGIANNKTLAKMANVIAKRNTFEGIFKIDDIDKHNMFLKDFPVSDIWGIGEKYTNKLNSFGINFAYQLMECNDSWLKANFPLTMLRIVLELRGRPGFNLKANDRMKRSITVLVYSV